MAVTFVATGSIGNAGAGTMTPGLPAGLTADDIMILHIVGESEDGDTDGQGDWDGTLIGTVESDPGVWGANDKSRCTVYWRRATASESAPTVSDPGNSCGQCAISAFRGCETAGSPLSGTAVSTSALNSASYTATGVTTVDDGSMVFVMLTAGDDGTYSGETNANLVSITEAYQSNSATGSASMFGGYYGIKTTAGATGNTTGSNDISEEEAHWTIALKPPASGPSIPILQNYYTQNQ